MQQYTDQNIQYYTGPRFALQRPEAYQHLYEMMVTTDPAGAAAVQRGRGERRYHVALLPAITVPVLIVVGAEDYFTPLPVAQIMQDAIPQAQLVCLEAAGHLPNMETPEKFNAALTRFLRQNNL